MKLGGTALKVVGLVVLAVLAVGVAVFSMTRQVAAPPVSEQVRSYTPAPLPTVEPVTVSVIGDSYSAGTGAGSPSLGWVARLANNQLWSVNNVARGGTGYSRAVTDSAKEACGFDYCPSYPEMIDKALESDPQVVIVAGGRNDASVPTGEESEAIRSFYETLRAKAPDAKIVAFNPLWDMSAPPASVGAISASVKESVEAVGGVYLDAGQPLTKTEGLLADDGVHPNAAGHAAIFESKLRLLQDAGLAIR